MNMFSQNIKFWGKTKQNILNSSSILVAGMGGLGCIVAENLTRAGIGKLILIDKDIIENSNLNRQILFHQNDIGKSKVETAKTKLIKINPDLEIDTYHKDITSINKVNLHKFDGIADCFDNFKSRFFLQDDVLKDQFLVHGGVTGDFGQVTTITKGITPSLQQIFPNQKEIDAPASIPQSVLTIGSIMAHEIINNLFDHPQLINKLLIIDLSDFSFEKITLSKPADLT